MATRAASSGKRDIALNNLGFLREHHSRLERDDAYYVRLAYSYGVEVGEIASASGLSVEKVRSLLTAQAS